MKKYNENERILLCYLSGQMSERQWQEHRADHDFSVWLRDHNQAKTARLPVH